MPAFEADPGRLLATRLDVAAVRLGVAAARFGLAFVALLAVATLGVSAELLFGPSFPLSVFS